MEVWKEPEFEVLTKEDFTNFILANARSGACQACSACHCIPYCGLFK